MLWAELLGIPWDLLILADGLTTCGARCAGPVVSMTWVESGQTPDLAVDGFTDRAARLLPPLPKHNKLLSTAVQVVLSRRCRISCTQLTRVFVAGAYAVHKGHLPTS